MAQDLARIRAFVQVYEAGGFSAAARQYGRSKALLSKYVTDLEDYLGVRLMNRTTRRLNLTEAGDAYYREVSQILLQLDDLDVTITERTAEPRGLLRISAPRNFGETTLGEALFDFLEKHPAVTLDLRLEDRFVDLVDEGIDLAIRISSMPDSSLIARRLATTRLVVCAAPSVIAKHGKPETPEALRNLPCVIDTNMRSQANWHFISNGQAISVHVEGRLRVNSPLASKRAALDGLGFAALPNYLASKEISAGRLVPVLKEFAGDGLTLQAVYPHRRHVSGKVRAVIDHLVAWFGTHSLG